MFTHVVLLELLLLHIRRNSWRSLNLQALWSSLALYKQIAYFLNCSGCNYLKFRISVLDDIGSCIQLHFTEYPIKLFSVYVLYSPGAP